MTFSSYLLHECAREVRRGPLGVLEGAAQLLDGGRAARAVLAGQLWTLQRGLSQAAIKYYV